MILRALPQIVVFVLKQFLKPNDYRQHCFKCIKNSNIRQISLQIKYSVHGFKIFLSYWVQIIVTINNIQINVTSLLPYDKLLGEFSFAN